LFIEHSPEKAAEIADVIMPLLLDWGDLDSVAWRCQDFFISVAFPMSFPVILNRCKIYWQLWNDFPESQYA